MLAKNIVRYTRRSKARGVVHSTLDVQGKKKAASIETRWSDGFEGVARDLERVYIYIYIYMYMYM